MTPTCPADTTESPIAMEYTDYSLYGKPEVQNIVAITYHHGIPSDVATEHEWDHTGNRWHVPGRDKPRGWAWSYYNFDYCAAEDAVYHHLSGGGGGRYIYDVPQYCDPYPPPAQLWLARPMRLVGYNRALARKQLLVPGDLARRGVAIIQQPLDLSRFAGGWQKSSGATTNPFDIAEESDGNYCEICKDWYPDDAECEHMDWCNVCGSHVYLLDNGGHTLYDKGPHGKPADHPLNGEEPEDGYDA